MRQNYSRFHLVAVLSAWTRASCSDLVTSAQELINGNCSRVAPHEAVVPDWVQGMLNSFNVAEMLVTVIVSICAIRVAAGNPDSDRRTGVICTLFPDMIETRCTRAAGKAWPVTHSSPESSVVVGFWKKATGN